MSTSEAEYPDGAHHGLLDLVVNRLFQVGLELDGALTQVGRDHDPQAGQRIRSAIAKIDRTIDELRHVTVHATGGRLVELPRR
jgi:hypothetical protein